jgi:hypothetical protein
MEAGEDPMFDMRKKPPRVNVPAPPPAPARMQPPPTPARPEPAPPQRTREANLAAAGLHAGRFDAGETADRAREGFERRGGEAVDSARDAGESARDWALTALYGPAIAYESGLSSNPTLKSAVAAEAQRLYGNSFVTAALKASDFEVHQELGDNVTQGNEVQHERLGDLGGGGNRPGQAADAADNARMSAAERQYGGTFGGGRVWGGASNEGPLGTGSVFGQGPGHRDSRGHASLTDADVINGVMGFLGGGGSTDAAGAGAAVASASGANTGAGAAGGGASASTTSSPLGMAMGFFEALFGGSSGGGGSGGGARDSSSSSANTGLERMMSNFGKGGSGGGSGGGRPDGATSTPTRGSDFGFGRPREDQDAGAGVYVATGRGDAGMQGNAINRNLSNLNAAGGAGDGRGDRDDSSSTAIGGMATTEREQAGGTTERTSGGQINWDQVFKINQLVNPGSE